MGRREKTLKPVLGGGYFVYLVCFVVRPREPKLETLNHQPSTIN